MFDSKSLNGIIINTFQASSIVGMFGVKIKN